MKKRLGILVYVVGLLGMVDTQAQHLSFEETLFNFGEIREENGKVDHTFQFVNGTSDTVWITNVKASCGCTTPNWTKEQLAPGDSGEVMARYNPYNRPGKFRKSLRVSLNNGSNTNLYIEGNVLPRPRTVEDDLPVLIGGIRLKYNSLNMGRISTKEPVSKTFEVYNATDSILSFLSEETVVPDHVTITFVPESLEPKTRGKIEVTYDVAAKNDLGYVKDRIAIKTSETGNSTKELNLIATIQEYFAPMTDAERAMAPQLRFENRILNFGKVAKDSQVSSELVLTNAGKEPLNIRYIKSNCDCIETEISTMDISPGKSDTLKVNFNAERRRGRQYKTVTVFSNDPVTPTQVISIKAEVLK